MAPLRIALAQVNPTVGDVAGNAALVKKAVADAAGRGAQLVLLPEMMITGYPIEDLALRASFQLASRECVKELAADLESSGFGQCTVVVGYLDTNDESPATLGVPAGRPVNAAAVIRGGEVISRYVKHHLPNYGVFDEFRYFLPGSDPVVIDVDGAKVAIAICEDLWQEGGPVAQVRDAGVDLLAVINGSPYERNKDDVRLELVSRRAREAGCALAYVNMVGGQDELVFDGDSIVVNAHGEVIARAPQFTPALVVVDLDSSTDIASRLSDEAEMYAALVVGLRDYVRKNNFKSVLLGLSGGIDSALVAAIACDAIGAQNVFGVSMPSKYSSQHSQDDAADLAQRTGLNYRSVPIAPMVNTFHEHLTLTGLAEENLQARVRGMTLMAISNQEGHLVLATGNKSELAVGYSTIYGDAVGGFAPIKDVPKTDVWRLSRWRNEQAHLRNVTPPIPENSISKPPSAELRPGQLDSDSLPDYGELDAIIDGYVHGDLSAEALIAAGHNRTNVERVLRLIDTAEYKRRQYPPGTKISLRAFGRDRRLPITNSWRESAG